jgi:hypothetical protein
MLELYDIFPKTIALAQLRTLTPSLINDAIAFLDETELVELGSDGAYTEEQQLLELPLLRAGKEELLTLCMEFSQAWAHEVKAIGICNSWGNVVGLNQSIRYHRHDNSYISGSFYLTEGSKFNLLNNLTSDLFSIVPKIKHDAPHKRSFESLDIDPKPGKVIIFPSGMYHSVAASTNDKKRYSIAFNAIPLGEVGKPTSLMDVQLSRN